MNEQEYAGFWIRVGASIIDSILILIIITPILMAIYGTNYWENDYLILGSWEVLLDYVFPAIAIIVFWIYKSATPGKIALKLTIVDAKTGGKMKTISLKGNYSSYYVSTLPLFLGLIWVAFDKRKQGWHDKLAGTVVIRNNLTESVKFEGTDKK